MKNIYLLFLVAASLMGASAFAGGGDLDPLGKDVRNIIFKMLDPQSRAALSGVDRQCRDETAELREGDHLRYNLRSVRSGRSIIRLKGNGNRVSPAFAALGPMYRVGDLIWSGVADREMDLQEAVQFCRDLGAELPTENQYLALARAMGDGTPQGYNAGLLPDMNHWFWTSSPVVGRENHAYQFWGYQGQGRINANAGFLPFWVRCVRAAATRI